MKEFLSLLWEWRFVIAVGAVALIYCFMEWNKVKAKLYSFMLQAKSLAKDAVLKSGQQQEEWVVNKAYQFLPKALTLFISRQLMQKIVHWLYHKAKDYIDDGQINNSIQ